MLKYLFSLYLLLCPFYLFGQKQQKFSVLQWNIWQEGTMVEGGYEAIVNGIAELKPDFVTFSEVRNYNNTRFCDRIVSSLKEKGVTYYSFYSYDSGLLSRYPISDSTVVYPEKNDHGSIYRLLTHKDGHTFAVYTAHLDYRNDAYYDVRGYDGSTWKEIPKPVDVSAILRRNELSERDDAIRESIETAKADIEKGYIVIIGGDFNEPSWMDWDEKTRNLYDHNGLVIPWTVTKLLTDAGYKDAYRVCHLDHIDYPGFTYPSNNDDVPVSKLTWAPKSDERDRIDYVFYYPVKGMSVCNAFIYGPDSSIMKSRRVKDSGRDQFVLYRGVWPTDHKGVLIDFEIK